MFFVGMDDIINVKSNYENKKQAVLKNYGNEALERDWMQIGKDIRAGMQQYEGTYGRTR